MEKREHTPASSLISDLRAGFEDLTTEGRSTQGAQAVGFDFEQLEYQKRRFDGVAADLGTDQPYHADRQLISERTTEALGRLARTLGQTRDYVLGHSHQPARDVFDDGRTIDSKALPQELLHSIITEINLLSSLLKGEQGQDQVSPEVVAHTNGR